MTAIGADEFAHFVNHLCKNRIAAERKKTSVKLIICYLRLDQGRHLDGLRKLAGKLMKADKIIHGRTIVNIRGRAQLKNKSRFPMVRIFFRISQRKAIAMIFNMLERSNCGKGGEGLAHFEAANGVPSLKLVQPQPLAMFKLSHQEVCTHSFRQIGFHVRTRYPHAWSAKMLADEGAKYSSTGPAGSGRSPNACST